MGVSNKCGAGRGEDEPEKRELRVLIALLAGLDIERDSTEDVASRTIST